MGIAERTCPVGVGASSATMPRNRAAPPPQAEAPPERTTQREGGANATGLRASRAAPAPWRAQAAGSRPSSYSTRAAYAASLGLLANPARRALAAAAVVVVEAGHLGTFSPLVARAAQAGAEARAGIRGCPVGTALAFWPTLPA